MKSPKEGLAATGHKGLFGYAVGAGGPGASPPSPEW